MWEHFWAERCHIQNRSSEQVTVHTVHASIFREWLAVSEAYNGLRFIASGAQMIRNIDIWFILDRLFKQLNLTLLLSSYHEKHVISWVHKKYKVNLVMVSQINRNRYTQFFLCKVVRLFNHGNQFSKPDMLLALSSSSERCLESLVAMETFTLTIPYCHLFLLVHVLKSVLYLLVTKCHFCTRSFLKTYKTN